MRTLAPLLLTLALVASACAPADGDGDGVPASLDCNDSNAAIYPGATEICDGIDNDCNQVVDDDYARGGQIFFLDRDGDGAGVWELAQVRCSQPAGYVDNADDCADDDADVYPGAPEFCDKIDQDCNGVLDNDPIDGTPYFTDLDGDGYGGIESVTYACEQPEGYISTGGDCDDFSVIIGPEAVERCNQIDDDCNGIVDDATSEDATVWYADADLDGYGSEDDTKRGCAQPEYYVAETSAGDCDDADPTINPEAKEICNDGIDNNCNGSADTCAYSNWSFGQTDMVTITGSGSSAYFGRDLAIVGDVNGDGIDDALIGGYRAGGGSCSGSYCGGAMLVYGDEDLAGKSFTVSDTVFYSASSTYDYAGVSVAGLGDVNGDGYADFGLGSYGNDYNSSSSGAVFVIYGGGNMPAMGTNVDLNATPMIFGPDRSSAYLGYSLTGADVDGDGFSDVIMGASRDYHDGNYYGKVYVRYGGASKVAFEGVADLGYVYGSQSYEYLGSQSGHGIGDGDFDGDGFGDVLIGSYQYDYRGEYSTGRVYLMYGDGDRVTGAMPASDAATALINGATRYGYLGSAASGVGDTNGDGYEDLAYCGYGEASYAGRCYVKLGGTERLEGSVDTSDEVAHDFFIEGESSNYYLGYYGVGGDDYDNDGLSDIMTASYQWRPDSSTYGTGAMGVLPGAEEREKTRYVHGKDFPVVNPNVRYSYMGSVGGERGDLNGDGYADGLVGAYGSKSYVGEAYIFFGGGL